MQITTYLVDSFTDQVFSGNPAGVCLESEKLTDEQRQNIAAELGLSETAFVSSQNPDGSFHIRYFSPKMEIPLCGHATLASAKVLFDLRQQLEIEFITGQGISLPIRREGADISMIFPTYALEDASAPQSMLIALGLTDYICAKYNRETNILLAEIDDPSVLKALTPNYETLVRSSDDYNGVLVTAKSDDPEFDFYSRYFWPWSGTDEDPVTGGTHTFLAPYWANKLNKTRLRSYQCSERGGCMDLEILPEQKLRIMAQAVVVLSGNLFL